MKIDKRLREHLAKLGAKGGKAAAQRMTPEQRSERAKRAVMAREAKRQPKPGNT